MGSVRAISSITVDDEAYFEAKLRDVLRGLNPAQRAELLSFAKDQAVVFSLIEQILPRHSTTHVEPLLTKKHRPA